MPRLSAEHALRVGQVERYRHWTGGLAFDLCRWHGVKAVDLQRFRRLAPSLDISPLERNPWDAKALVFPSGHQLIVAKGDGKIQRIIWSVVHELGHLLLGHKGATLDLATGEYRDAPSWAEEEADRFARNVLLPADEILHYRQELRISPTAIAQRKGVSFAAVMVRLKTMRRDGQFDRWAADAEAANPVFSRPEVS